MSKLQKQVATQVKKLLSQKGMSAERLALEIGMSTGFIYEFLNGKKDVSLKSLERLADGLEVKPKDLMPD
jgi:transcriptional regulator with XRE-family HTH domain